MKELEIREAIASGSFIRERSEYGQRYLLPLEIVTTQKSWDAKGGMKAVRCDSWTVYDGEARRNGEHHKPVLLGQIEGATYGRNTAGKVVPVTLANIDDIARQEVIAKQECEQARKDKKQRVTELTETLTRILGDAVRFEDVEVVLLTPTGRMLIDKVLAEASSLTTGGE